MADGIVFDVQLFHAENAREIVRFKKRRETGMETDGGFFIDGQKFAVAPNALWPFFYFLAGNDAFNLVIVIVHLQRSKTKFANIDRLGRINPMTLATF